ncbi:MAG: hypothetical protein WAT09_07490 [Paracoccaceae bacterium]
MRDTEDSNPPAPPRKSASETAREARLKVALKANMGRRKAQAQARSCGTDADDNDNAALPGKPQKGE